MIKLLRIHYTAIFSKNIRTHASQVAFLSWLVALKSLETMTNITPKPPWTQSGWLEQASRWIQSELTKIGIITGSIEQSHARPWSAVFRVPTEWGVIYFKACAPALRHEPALTKTLSTWRPDCLPEVLAIDAERGWMLMSDGGQRLREIIKNDRDIRHWEKLLPLYAELQIEIASRLPELLVLETPDRQLGRFPEQYEQLLASTEMLRIDLPDGLSPAEYKRLRTLQGHIAELCDQLSSSRIPASIHHGDFHDANIFLRDGHYVFFDWGDSSISHPFFSLRTAFVSIENTLHFEESSPQFARLCDAYLEPWTEYGSHKELIELFDLASCLSPISSALAWNRVVSSLDPSYRDDYANAIPSLLKEYLSTDSSLLD